MSAEHSTEFGSDVDKPFLLGDWEHFWVDLQPFLFSRGYRLRPRYDPDWIPSWHTSKKWPHDCEDSIDSQVRFLYSIPP